VLDRYSTAQGRWSQVQSSLVDGEGRSSPYWGWPWTAAARSTGLDLA